MVFLHHGLGSVAQWRDFPRRLAQATGCPALVFDRIGHGQSPAMALPRSRRYHYEEAAALRELLESEGVSDCILVGHSDGATIALLYPAMSGAQPRAIVCEAAHVFVEECTRAGIRRTLQDWRETLRPRLMRFHGDKTDDLVLSWAGVWLSPSFDSFDISEALGRIRCPVLAVQGDSDPYGSEAQLHSLMRAGASVQKLTECGHDPHHEQPQQTLAIMRDWIASVKTLT